ncbi:hypothetical protein ANO11243_032090 [Dothideomycetidae sp. 11243]|nr:hypothetical protein ANO11243_032090 [fungal sp. No.11243]
MNDYYSVLGLSERRADAKLDLADVRKAYHRALLQHHPDKLSGGHRQEARPKAVGERFSIDQITNAFDTLKDPSAKSDYDRKLALVQRSTLSGNGDQEDARFFSGLDTVDLDDLDFDDSTQTWRRSCRCGHEEGFVVTEDDLESAASVGELVIGCRGCSLWLKILFQAAPVEDGTAEGDDIMSVKADINNWTSGAEAGH